MTALTMLRRPSAFAPILMSASAIGIVLIYLGLRGPAPQADEGTAARAWQVLMLLQVPLILAFSAKWVVRSPREAVPVLLLQLLAAAAAVAPVVFLRW